MVTDTARNSGVLRDSDAADNLELLLVAAIATILSIRGFLHLTGYPQVGGDGLHIAHMLWGGLFMLVAIGIYIVFWNPSARRAASFLAGIGWGTFIDELGKFITDDHNYFFEPTIALLYILFVLGFLAVGMVRARVEHSPEEHVINDRLHELDESGRVTRMASSYFGIREFLDRTYDRFSSQPWFSKALVAIALVAGAFNLWRVVWWAFLAEARFVWEPGTGSGLLSILFLWIGIFSLRRSTVSAYRWWQRAVLMNLLVTQIFLFNKDQFGALTGLAWDLVLYGALRYLIAREEQIEKDAAGPRAA